MNCSTCKGRVLVDRTYSEKKHLELSCIMCGRRWMLDKEKSILAARLLQLEQARANASAVSL